MLTLYHSPGACSLAAHILLEESGLPYGTKRIDLRAGQQRSPEYLAVNPKGRVPALVDGAEVITESPAILHYIAGLAPDREFLPRSLISRTRVLEWMNWLSGSLHAVAFAGLIHPDWFAHATVAQLDVKERAAKSVADHFADINRQLDGRQWAVGETFSLVDPYLLVFYTWGQLLRFPMDEYRHYRELARRLQLRPAVRRVLEDERISPIN
jgi:glutathione S-transferase